MNKNILVSIIIFLGLIGAGIVYLAVSTDTKTSDDALTQSQKNAGTPPSDIQSSQNLPGTFTDYSETAFASTSGTRILFFHAPWCFQCREIEKDIKANLDQLPAGTTIFKIDYDSNQALRQKYDVKLQTSFIKFDSQGNVIQNFVAYDEPNFANLKKNIF